MTATVRDADAAAAPYLAAVADLLAGAAPAERGELLDDLAAHLAELAAEPGPPLAERLGPPDDYARELVTSAGIAPAPGGAGRRLRDRAVDRWQRSEAVAAVRAFLPELRPAWWVLRAVLAAAWLLVWANDGRFGADLGDQLIVAVVGLLAAVPSVRIGRATDAGASPWRDRAATTAGVVGALVVLATVTSLPRYVFIDGSAAVPDHVLRSDGVPITNIHAYDRDGNPVEVFLYDQDGRPIDDLAEWDPHTGEALDNQLETDAGGAELRNLYPRRQRRLTYGPRGERWERVPAPGVVVPGSEASPTTTTTVQASSNTTVAVFRDSPPEPGG